MTKAEQRHHVDSGLAVLHAVRDENGIQRPLTLREIADAVGCSRNLIDEIEKKALKKLRHPSRIRILSEVKEELA